MGRFSFSEWMSRYAKPHLPYDQQLQRLAGRGLTYSNQAAAIRALKRIGYYRFSAYTYVFRKPGQPTADGTRPPRLDDFVDGATFESALALCAFDHELRLCLLDALQQIEVGMRVQIGYQLGKTDTFGHLECSALDAAACAKSTGTGHAFDHWLAQFHRLADEARGEEFVKHFHLHYDGDMPIWVATECMTFGALTRLYSLLNAKDASKIAENLEVRDAVLVHKWMKALNVLRNNCAHNSRVWNRSTIYPPAKPPKNLTHERLHHLRAADPDRLYFLAALCAHFVVQLNPDTNWPRTFKTRARKFPGPLGMTLENTLGFVPNWDSQAIWSYDPAVAKT